MKDFINGICIALIVIFSSVCVISIGFLIGTIGAIKSLLKAYPYPIDSFWSFDLAITLLIVFPILITISIVGIVLCAIRLKRKLNAKPNA